MAKEEPTRASPQRRRRAFRRYGGNKGRILTLFSDAAFEEFCDRNFVGVVDRDVDSINGWSVIINGIYYTEFTCLASRVAGRNDVSELMTSVFGRAASEQFLDTLYDVAGKLMLLRAWKQKEAANRPFPRISRYVADQASGGFNWDGYLAVYRQNVGPVDLEELQIQADAIAPQVDERERLPFHLFVEYLRGYARREKLIPSDVTELELYRHFRGRLWTSFDQTEISAIIGEKAAALT